MIDCSSNQPRLVFCSWCAFYPPLYAVLTRLVEIHGFTSTVIAPPRVKVSSPVLSASQYLTSEYVDSSIAEVRLVPLLNEDNPSEGFETAHLRMALADQDPHAIWIHAEPGDGITRQVLKRYWFKRHIKIACYVAENRWKRPPMIQRIKAGLLSLRINALMASSSSSSESIYKAFVPRSVKAYTLFLPTFDHKKVLPEKVFVEKRPGDLIIGFTGRICPEKGWRTLIDALRQLPPNFKAAIVGTGPDMEALKEQIDVPPLVGRASYLGVLYGDDIQAFYDFIDVLVVPSVTTPTWSEQFGRVIAEAMAARKTVIGSDSGSIPEVIGDAGLIVPEGNATALAASLRTVYEKRELLCQLGNIARRRFESQFSVDVYANRLADILSR